MITNLRMEHFEALVINGLCQNLDGPPSFTTSRNAEFFLTGSLNKIASTSASKRSIRRFVITEKAPTCLNSVLNVKVVVAAFNQEKALVGAFSMITNLWMEVFEALADTVYVSR